MYCVYIYIYVLCVYIHVYTHMITYVYVYTYTYTIIYIYIILHIEYDDSIHRQSIHPAEALDKSSTNQGLHLHRRAVHAADAVASPDVRRKYGSLWDFDGIFIGFLMGFL